MSESLQLANTYFEMADEAAPASIRHSFEETGWFILLNSAFAVVDVDHLWPDGTRMSRNSAFTAHIEQPRSGLGLGGAKRGPKPQTNSRFHQDPHKAEISYV